MPVTGATRGDLASDNPSSEQTWQARPVQAWAVRLLILALPVLAAIGASLAFETTVHKPAAVALAVAWWVATLLVATAAATLVERAARRLLPLHALLRMSLVFPDQAPSRFKLARAASSPARLAELAKETDDPRSAAASQVLALLVQLSRHDRLTRGHSERVRIFSDLLAEELGIAGLDRDKLRWAALLHDIGKISVPAAVLNSRDRPTPDEWVILKGHPEAGEALAGPLFAWLGDWAGAITEHHERFDGKGYPHGLAGEAISQAGRIVAITDCYETMTATRSYKKPLSVAAARAELTACSGGQFDPEMVRAFLLIGLSRAPRGLAFISWLVHLPLATRLQPLTTVLSGAQAVVSPIAAAVTASLVVVGSVAGLATPSSAAANGNLASQAARVTHRVTGPQHTQNASVEPMPGPGTLTAPTGVPPVEASSKPPAGPAPRRAKHQATASAGTVRPSPSATPLPTLQPTPVQTPGRITGHPSNSKPATPLSSSAPVEASAHPPAAPAAPPASSAQPPAGSKSPPPVVRSSAPTPATSSTPRPTSGSNSLTAGPVYEGNPLLAAGSHLSIGYDLSMSGSQPATSIGVSNLVASAPYACDLRGTSGTLTFPMSAATYVIPGHSSAWYPSDMQNAPSTYQLSTVLPPVCGAGALVRFTQGLSFTGVVTSTDTVDPVAFRFHFADPASNGMADADCSSGSCYTGWSASYQVTP